MSCSGEAEDTENELIQISPSVEKRLRKAKYGVSGHSTVELCHWTKNSFKNKGDCYKMKFYGITTHRCMEFSPAGMHCQNRCVYCWRPMEFYDSLEMPSEKVEDPEKIVENLMEERKHLIMGYHGDSRHDKQKLNESLRPSHYAISLSGEPTMYPKLPQLIKYLESLPETKSIFLVTNGQEPEMISRMYRENALPTQLYLSTNAPNEELFEKINHGQYKDAWKRWNETISLFPHLNTRTAIRITLIRRYNFTPGIVKEFAQMLKRGDPHFIEVKSYMHVGRSTNRLDYNDVLSMDEIREFSNMLAKELGDFQVVDESEVSKVALIQNMRRKTQRWIEKQKEVAI